MCRDHKITNSRITLAWASSVRFISSLAAEAAAALHSSTQQRQSGPTLSLLRSLCRTSHTLPVCVESPHTVPQIGAAADSASASASASALSVSAATLLPQLLTFISSESRTLLGRFRRLEKRAESQLQPLAACSWSLQVIAASAAAAAAAAASSFLNRAYAISLVLALSSSSLLSPLFTPSPFRIIALHPPHPCFHIRSLFPIFILRHHLYPHKQLFSPSLFFISFPLCHWWLRSASSSCTSPAHHPGLLPSCPSSQSPCTSLS